MWKPGPWITARGGVPISCAPLTMFPRDCGGLTSPRGNGLGYWRIGLPGELTPSSLSPRRWPAAAILLRRKPEARQAPHVDPILEVARRPEVSAVLAAISRHHLAQHAEAR